MEEEEGIVTDMIRMMTEAGTVITRTDTIETEIDMIIDTTETETDTMTGIGMTEIEIDTTIEIDTETTIKCFYEILNM